MSDKFNLLDVEKFKNAVSEENDHCWCTLIAFSQRITPNSSQLRIRVVPM